MKAYVLKVWQPWQHGERILSVEVAVYKINSFLFGLLILLSGCGKTPEWTLFYYANAEAASKSELSTEDIRGYYETLEQCQRKGEGMKRLSQSKLETFQCGQRCQIDAEQQLICLQTVK